MVRIEKNIRSSYKINMKKALKRGHVSELTVVVVQSLKCRYHLTPLLKSGKSTTGPTMDRVRGSSFYFSKRTTRTNYRTGWPVENSLFFIAITEILIGFRSCDKSASLPVICFRGVLMCFCRKRSLRWL